MLNSRNVNDLDPSVKPLCLAHVKAYNDLPEHKKNGVTLLVTSTRRDQEYQSYIYKFGRSIKFKPDGSKQGKVTDVELIGAHGFGFAYDVVPVVEGKAIYKPADLPEGFPLTFKQLWDKAAELGKKLGARWGGDWKKINDKPHFEYIDSLTYADLRAGKRPKRYYLYRIEEAQKEYQKAAASGNKAGMDATHKKAEEARAALGYSGGADGSQVIKG